MVKHVVSLSFVFMTFIVSTQAWANVSARVNRNPVMINETLVLFLENINPTTNANPDLSPLSRDFDVLGQSQSSQTQIINGSTTRKKEWQITIAPKSEGTLTIPAIRIGNEQTNAIQLKVVPVQSGTGNQAAPDFEVIVDVDDPSPYVQQQVVYHVKLIARRGIESGQISDPELPGAIIKKLGEDTGGEQLIDGQRVTVYERKYAIFPQTSGEVVIPKLTFEGVIASGRSGYFGRRGKRVIYRSKDVLLDVQPPPASYTGQWWLPAENLNIQEQWDSNPPVFKVGEPVTRTILLQASGLTAEQLPELPQASIPGLKGYPDQPETRDEATNTSMISLLIEKTAMVPEREGEFTLPEVEIQWWNTKTNKQETAFIPERVINVQPGAITENNAATRPSPSLPSIEIPQLERPVAEPTIVEKEIGTWWKWLSLILALGWAATVAYFITQSRTGKQHQTNEQKAESPTRREAKRKLVKLLKTNNASSSEIYSALIEWGKATYPESNPSNCLSIASLVGAGSLRDQLILLDRNRYQSGAELDRQSLLVALDSHVKNEFEDDNKAQKLPALYPES